MPKWHHKLVKRNEWFNIEEVLKDQNDINEAHGMQLEAISLALSELQMKKRQEKPRRRIGYDVKPGECLEWHYLHFHPQNWQYWQYWQSFFFKISSAVIAQYSAVLYTLYIIQVIQNFSDSL